MVLDLQKLGEKKVRVWVPELAELRRLTGASSTMSCSQEQKQKNARLGDQGPSLLNTQPQRSDQMGADCQTLVYVR